MLNSSITIKKKTDASSRFKVEEDSPSMSDISSFLVDDVEGSQVCFSSLSEDESSFDTNEDDYFE